MELPIDTAEPAPRHPRKKSLLNTKNLARGLAPNQEQGPDGRIRRKLPPAAPVTYEEGVPKTLCEMRHVSRYAEGAGEMYGLMILRKWKKEDLIGFLKFLNRLELRYMSSCIRAQKKRARAARRSSPR